jgi:transcriptional regulator with XRE-family HTH domain
MSGAGTETEFKQSFLRRVQSARMAAALTQRQMAELLGIPQDKYKHYESRTLLPHHLIGRFCTVCQVDPNWLMTGNPKARTAARDPQ